jgi:hypothetical protein
MIQVLIWATCVLILGVGQVICHCRHELKKFNLRVYNIFDENKNHKKEILRWMQNY